MVGKIKYKLLTWLINDLCRNDGMNVVSIDECSRCYQSIVDIYEKAKRVWLEHETVW